MPLPKIPEKSKSSTLSDFNINEPYLSNKTKANSHYLRNRGCEGFRPSTLIQTDQSSVYAKNEDSLGYFVSLSSATLLTA